MYMCTARAKSQNLPFFRIAVLIFDSRKVSQVKTLYFQRRLYCVPMMMPKIVLT